MSREISTPARQDVLAPETGQAFPELLTISHPDLAEPIRVCNDAVDITSRGNLFTALPFRLVWPQDKDGARPAGRIRLDNISQDIELAIQSITSAPTVLIEAVRADTPDVVEATFPNYILRVVDRDIALIEGDVLIDDLSRRSFPPRVYGPHLFPNLFPA